MAAKFSDTVKVHCARATEDRSVPDGAAIDGTLRLRRRQASVTALTASTSPISAQPTIQVRRSAKPQKKLKASIAARS